MASSEIQLDVSIAEADADDERLSRLTVGLRKELLELGTESAEPPPAEAAPQGAKGDPFTLGALTLAVVPTLLPKLAGFLQAWALRGGNRTVRIKTPAGLEVEFTPEKRLSDAELVALVRELGQSEA